MNSLSLCAALRVASFRKREFSRTAGVVLSLIAASAIGSVGRAAEPAAQLTAAFDRETQNLRIGGVAPEMGGYELRLETAATQKPESSNDVNEPGIIYLPPREGPISLSVKPVAPVGAENIFFFNPFVGARGWELVVRFPENAEGTWKLNGRFSRHGGRITRELRIPVPELEPGENLLHLEGSERYQPMLWFARPIAARKFAETVRLPALPADVTISLTMKQGADVALTVLAATTKVQPPAFTRRAAEIPPHWWEDRASVASAAVATGRNLLRSQIDEPRSLFDGGFHLVYDAQLKARRIPHWVWAWGPAITLLLELEKLPASHAAQLSASFRAAAIKAGKRSLEFEVKDPKHPASGITTVRWEPSRAVPDGWVEYASTADSLFLAGWGWMSLHAATREPIYLERTRSLIAATERLMGEYPVVPQDWVVQRERWTPHTLDESVFGMIAFRELYSATKSPAVANAGRRFLDSHLKHMSRGSGLLERAWLRDDDRAIWDPDIKGHAWVVEGYLDAYQFSGDTKYLELARSLAAEVLRCQHADGSWAYLFKRPTDAEARDDKGTAIWAYMLYVLHRSTGEAAHLEAARRALGWCLRQQYRGNDPDLDGGLLHANGMAYVRRRPMTILYSTTFMGLALLEELALTAK